MQQRKSAENKTDKCKIEYIITAVTFIKVILGCLPRCGIFAIPIYKCL